MPPAVKTICGLQRTGDDAQGINRKRNTQKVDPVGPTESSQNNQKSGSIDSAGTATNAAVQKEPGPGSRGKLHLLTLIEKQEDGRDSHGR